MGPVKLTTLIDIAESSDPAMRTQQLFEWYFERQKLLIQIAISLLGAFLVGLLLGALRGDFTNNWGLMLAGASILGLGLGSFILRSYLKIRSVGEDFVAALELTN